MDDRREHISIRAKVTPLLACITACIVAVAAPFILGQFAEIAADHEVQLNDWTLFILDHRWWMIALPIPAILISLMGIVSQSGPARVGMAMLSALTLGAVFLIILYVAIGVLGPLYQYQPL